MATANDPNMKDKKRRFELLYSQLLELSPDNAMRDGLLKTPQRASETFDFLTSGYAVDLDQLVNDALFECENKDLIVQTHIEFYSLCEHHLLPFFGRCHIGYLPGDKVIGLSKMARIVDAFSRRLQVQETLTRQIARAILHYTGAKGVAVVMQAQHLCMMMRGVQKQNGQTRSSVMLGLLRTNLATRTEFLRMIEL